MARDDFIMAETTEIMTQTAFEEDLRGPEMVTQPPPAPAPCDASDAANDLETFLFDALESISFPPSFSFNINESVQNTASYLINTEWIFCVSDLKKVLPYPESWQALRLPIRLKIAIAELLQAREMAECSSSLGLPVVLATTATPPASLPWPWQAIWDETAQSYYYFNRETERMSWHLPESVELLNESDVPDSIPWTHLDLQPGFSSEDAMYTKVNTHVFLQGKIQRSGDGSCLCVSIPPNCFPTQDIWCEVDVFDMIHSSDDADDDALDPETGGFTIVPRVETSTVRINASKKILELITPVPVHSWISLACIYWEMQELDSMTSSCWTPVPGVDAHSSSSGAYYHLDGDMCRFRGSISVNNLNPDSNSETVWTSLCGTLPRECCPPRAFHGQVRGHQEEAGSSTTEWFPISIYAQSQILRTRASVPNNTLLCLDSLSWSCSDEDWQDLCPLAHWSPTPDLLEQRPQIRMEVLENNISLIRFRGTLVTQEALSPDDSGLQESSLGTEEPLWPESTMCCLVHCVRSCGGTTLAKIRISPFAPYFHTGMPLQEQDGLILDSIHYIQNK